MTELTERPKELSGRTYKLRWPDQDHAFYITINDIEQDGKRRPFEIFINSKNMGHYAWTVALTRMMSAVFRRGGDVGFVAEELKAVFDPRGGQWSDSRYVPSLIAMIGEVVDRHIAGDKTAPKDAVPDAMQTESRVSLGGLVISKICPRCSAPALQKTGGCDICLSCGYSKCD